MYIFFSATVPFSGQSLLEFKKFFRPVQLEDDRPSRKPQSYFGWPRFDLYSLTVFSTKRRSFRKGDFLA